MLFVSCEVAAIRKLCSRPTLPSNLLIRRYFYRNILQIPLKLLTLLLLLLLLWLPHIKPIQHLDLPIAAGQLPPERLILPLQLLNNNIPLITPLLHPIFYRTRFGRIRQRRHRLFYTPVTRVNTRQKQAIVVTAEGLFEEGGEFGFAVGDERLFVL